MKREDEDRLINDFAIRSFRNTADKDYIHARLAYRALLMPQFLWSSLHCLEKYAKCILILNRIKRKDKDIRHEITPALNKVRQFSNISLDFSEQTNNFFLRLEGGARFRYLETSWYTHDYEITKLDRAVWELRRYCQTLIYHYDMNGNRVDVNEDNLEKIKGLDHPTLNNTYIYGGVLEKLLLGDKNNFARQGLVWRNLYYTTSKRRSTKIPNYFMAENSPLSLNPYLIDIINQYVYLPGEVIQAYKNRK
jgi:hypothetical protein